MDSSPISSKVFNSFKIHSPVLLEPLIAAFVIRENPQNFFVELAGVIHVPAVTELVHDYAIKDFLWHQHQKTVEIEIPVYRTASPARFLQADKDALVGNACHFGVKLYPLRNHHPSLFLDLSDVFFCERVHGDSQFRLLFNFFKLPCNPIFFLADKVFCNKGRCSKWHFYDDFLVI